MKRLNPKTGAPFQRGDTRDEDDKLFFHYEKSFREKWVTKEEFVNMVKIMSNRRREYERKNPEKHRNRIAKNRADNLKRKPKWIKDVFQEEIKELYKMAVELEKIFPWKMHVDHVVPKQGKLVSGLHVPWNLEIIPWIDNIKKGNKFDVNAEQPPPLSEGTYKQGRVYTQFGTLPTTGAGQDNNNPDNYSGTVPRQDTDHRAQEGSGNSVGHGGKEVVSPQASFCFEDHGQPDAEIVRLEFGRRYLSD
jgi:5-methylcytosine-specific restriction endonuclease McrA